MTNSTWLGAAVLSLTLAPIAGCERRAPPAGSGVTAAPAGPASRSEPCRPARGTKLGQPFARVCPDPSSGAALSPFWIHAAPVPCSAGEHGEIECRTVVPLVAPGDGTGTARLPAVNVPLVGASVAHRLCAMRFAGRLPTRRERARARDALGLGALWIVEAKGTAGRHFDFRQIPEWVTEVPCDQPSVLGPECGAAHEPSDVTTHDEGVTEWNCDAEVVGDGVLPIVAAGGSCPSGTFDPAASSGVLPCGAGITVETPSRPTRFAFQLRCHPAAARTTPPNRTGGEEEEIAAVRCVVPESLLDGRVR